MNALIRVGWRYGHVLGMLALAWCLVACTTTKPVEIPPALPTTEEARCAAGGGTWDKSNFKLTNGYCAKGTPAQCQASGGNWQRVCMMGTLACVQPYVDAHKTCRSGADCQGRRCLQAAEARGNSQSQTGRCLPNNNPCYFGINLENGQPVPTAVAD
jgi:hypothetical protein